ncbi:hypothetical protein N7520_008497 [Penicillium odoratum]|uniref:uncharacterized protein n=1 Tax=Penicillium odoratum TaxID=1167516 RepID=UPI002548EDD4|nr:uncharacterized protein N7520_008497 [Penicillium odoratum]KAJ5751580.1 hypothetical protein N7520_008497 [Penicillium odoratum]
MDLVLRYKPNGRCSCDFRGRGPLSLAVIGGNTAIVERILQSQEIDAGTNINHQSSYDDASLLLAAKKLNQQQ